MKQIQQDELIFLSIISVLATAFLLVPLIFGYATQTQESVFMGEPVHVGDANNHLHLGLQASQGEILLTNKFTPEDVPKLFFNPYHLLLGWISAILGVSLIAVLTSLKIIFSILFFFVAYLFLSRFVEEKQIRMLAILFIAFSSGFGFFWSIIKGVTGKGITSADMWVTDMNTFLSLGQPHFTLSMVLLLVVLYFGYVALEKKSYKSAIIAGLTSLVLSTIHLFDIVTMTVVLCTWFLFRQIKHGWDWKEFLILATIGIITVPGVAYYVWVFFFNPAYSSWNELNQTVTPNIIKLLSGFGIIFLLAVYAVYRRKGEIKRISKIAFLFVWCITNFILVYIPINVQRRFLLGLHIPLCILAAVGTFELVRNMSLAKKRLIIAGIFIVAISTTIFITAQRVSVLHDEVDSVYGNGRYLTSSELMALNWIDQHISDDKIIFAPHKISNYIPAVSGNKIFVGHWAQTINFTQRYELMLATYETGNLPQDEMIDIVWWDQDEVIPKNIGSEIYRNEEIVLYNYK